MVPTIILIEHKGELTPFYFSIIFLTASAVKISSSFKSTGVYSVSIHSSQ
ncbi:hypothetical protein LBGG_00125 [Lactobacillus gasseri MV-22]|nr:hypothetical protein LBGG_00125 [Lactobacillus gasseri MV-22]